MYLSRLILDPWSPQVMSEMGDPYQMHRTLMKAFPGAEEGGPGRVLFRVDVDRRTDVPTVLVQSEKEPDWTFLLERRYLLDVPGNPAWRAYSPVLRAGQRLRFLLRANPTIRRVFEAGKPGKRIGLVREEDQMAWLKRKAEAGGFSLDAVRVIPRGKRRSNRNGASGTHICVDFQGVLTVTEPAKFLETLRSGIGAAKGYGFGLLSIAPV